MDLALSLTGKRWMVPEETCNPQTVVKEIALKRDLCNGELFDPASLQDIGKAVERIRQAVKSKEHVGIFGDYDCDGITSVAQLVRFFRRCNIYPSIRLPHRIHDGYGLKPKHVEEFTANGTTLLLTVDTGIAARDAVDRARDAGMNVIVIDHHEMQEESLPSAIAILHPHLATPRLSPLPCAAGLVSLLLAALEGGARPEKEEDRVLAAIGTIADIVELRSGNRTIVHDGLAAISLLPDGPLRTLINGVRSSDAPIVSRDIGFRIAPRLNAAGRMDDPMIALNALLDGGDALGILDHLNTSRQSLVEELFESLLAALPEREYLPPLIGLADERFPPGVLGLLAGKLTEKFGRPSMVANITGDTCTASLRSIPAVHITELLSRSAHLLTNFGGHAQAAGCTFARENFEELTAALQADIARSVAPENLVSTLTIDAALSPSAITLDLCEELQELEPFGHGNPEPRFLLQNISIQSPRLVGNTGKHLAASIGHLRAIGFGLSHLIPNLSQPVDIVCRININTWNGRRTPQIVLDDVRHVQVIEKRGPTMGPPSCLPLNLRHGRSNRSNGRMCSRQEMQSR
ncbi:single-stranded-DNA-specific exonuclease RecJ [Candidatus Peribacteria bacterium RIFCSPLOWO2_02_FULL_55_36]|nr:MAG: single-stranded-DNA-specific exonuclease RecJ [Candidatus Peribacteria bacterium RIFCSPHIGHO2_01_FULL_54_22]OGJ67361.1 MAG: single-stranded-DNA-specific exonuclease RecJ [Candidatus Peribacteria bacterium RIFCSPLOWO2_01_FULL_54_110]OGJ69896.1 MAG: single-stranded-DNA-specific exonuclease RecJ [Candidatus Peribacteria bacterium RIFCSPLOWO2_02_FULL_55_36]